MCEARAGIYYLCSKIRNIVLYDLAHITCPEETMKQLLSRLNTCQAFRPNSWQLGQSFDGLQKASLQRDWVADRRQWQCMTLGSLVDGVQGWQQLVEENERAKTTLLQNEAQLQARDSEGTREGRGQRVNPQIM